MLLVWVDANTITDVPRKSICRTVDGLCSKQYRSYLLRYLLIAHPKATDRKAKDACITIAISQKVNERQNIAEKRLRTSKSM
jgi:hypothetical protein